MKPPHTETPVKILNLQVVQKFMSPLYSCLYVTDLIYFSYFKICNKSGVTVDNDILETDLRATCTKVKPSLVRGFKSKTLAGMRFHE